LDEVDSKLAVAKVDRVAVGILGVGRPRDDRPATLIFGMDPHRDGDLVVEAEVGDVTSVEEPIAVKDCGLADAPWLKCALTVDELAARRITVEVVAHYKPITDRPRLGLSAMARRFPSRLRRAKLGFERLARVLRGIPLTFQRGELGLLTRRRRPDHGRRIAVL